ncbi:MAG: AAA family ATPase [Methanosarcinales archaeon]|nr:AAA family ATPase [Methanosarcinales archaeon]
MNLVLQAFYELYSTELEYFMLDEIQNVPGWELFANRLRRTKKVVLTGGNAKLLSGELATHLTGRYTDVTLYPFSFCEFLKFKEIEPDIYSTGSIARIKNALKEYMDVGGFPEVYLFQKEMAARIYEDIIYKDIISRHDIRNKKSFSQIAKYLVSNFS